MTFDDPHNLALLALAALAAGAINAIAGGGTLLTFPALLGMLPPIPESGPLANATSKLAIVPGTIAGAAGYFQELQECRRLLLWLFPPSIIGGVLGTLLVTRMPPEVFARLVPWLILTAALLLVAQPPIVRWARRNSGDRPLGKFGIGLAVVAQFVIALYGGYFGAGIGILMLTALGFMGSGDIHHMNAVKNLLASVINTISAVTFIFEGKVLWECAAVMAVASVVGGYGGARFARRLPARLVRWAVVVIGLTLAAYYFTQ